MGACYRQQQEMDEQQQYEQFLINEEMKNDRNEIRESKTETGKAAFGADWP